MGFGETSKDGDSHLPVGYFLHRVIKDINVIICSSIPIDKFLPNKYYRSVAEIDYAIYIIKKYSIGKIQYVFQKDPILKIIALSVIEEYQNKSIGRKLMIEALKDAQKQNIKTVQLDCIGASSDKHNLYIKLGMKYVNKKEGPEMIGSVDEILFTV